MKLFNLIINEIQQNSLKLVSVFSNLSLSHSSYLTLQKSACAPPNKKLTKTNEMFQFTDSLLSQCKSYLVEHHADIFA